MSKPAIFTREDVGCWIDGAYGESHAMQKLSAMLEGCKPVANVDPEEYAEALAILASGAVDKLSDDNWETDLAEETLIANTEKGLCWLWVAGDLVLTTQDQLD